MVATIVIVTLVSKVVMVGSHVSISTNAQKKFIIVILAPPVPTHPVAFTVNVPLDSRVME